MDETAEVIKHLESAEAKKARYSRPAPDTGLRGLDKLIQDAPWDSDLVAVGLYKRLPGVRRVNDAGEMQAVVAKGYRLRAITRDPFWPDKLVGVFYLSPATAEENRERGIGNQLAEMVRGDDLRRAGLRH